MKILFINQFFWPELAATSQLLTDLTRHLARQGEEVTVICGNSGYAGNDSTERPDVRIIRAPNLPFRRGLVGRAASYLSFLLSALWRGLTLPKPDLIVCMTTPPLLPAVGAWIAGLRGIRFFIWEMDVYPEVAIDLQVLKPDSILTRVSLKLAMYAHRKADGIIALSECMKERLAKRGDQKLPIHIAENWVDSARFDAKRDTDPRKLTVVYPGSLGLAHDVDTIAAVMKRFARDDRFRFVFVGGGAQMNQLRDFCEREDVANAEFHGYKPPNELAQIMASSDVGLVTQNPRVMGSLVPSKIYAIMASGVPLLFIGPDEVEPARVIERFGCGSKFNCGESAQVGEWLLEQVEDKRSVERAGAAARRAFLQNYDRLGVVERIAGILGCSSAHAPKRKNEFALSAHPGGADRPVGVQSAFRIRADRG